MGGWQDGIKNSGYLPIWRVIKAPLQERKIWLSQVQSLLKKKRSLAGQSQFPSPSSGWQQLRMYWGCTGRAAERSFPSGAALRRNTCKEQGYSPPKRICTLASPPTSQPKIGYAWAERWCQGPNSPRTDLFTHPPLYTYTLVRTRQVSCIEREIHTIGIFLYAQSCVPHVCTIAASFLQPFLPNLIVVSCLWAAARCSITLYHGSHSPADGSRPAWGLHSPRGSCWKTPTCQGPTRHFTTTQVVSSQEKKKKNHIWRFFPCKKMHGHSSTHFAVCKIKSVRN